MRYYYYIEDNQKKGPFTLEELAQRDIYSSTYIWYSGLEDWVYAGEVEELKEILNQNPPSIPHTDFEEQRNASLGVMSPMPKTWLVESILVTIFCCQPLGIVGIIYSVQVESSYNRGEFALASEYSRKARLWTLWGVGIIIFCLLGYILFFPSLFILSSIFS